MKNNRKNLPSKINRSKAIKKAKTPNSFGFRLKILYAVYCLAQICSIVVFPLLIYIFGRNLYVVIATIFFEIAYSIFKKKFNKK